MLSETLLQFYRDLSFFSHSIEFHEISSDFIRFYLGITDDFVGIAVNRRFPVLAFTHKHAGLVRPVAIYFATAT